MAKKTKREAVEKITKADALEVWLVEVPKSYSDSKKKTIASDFARQVDAYVKDQRDLILVAVKVK